MPIIPSSITAARLPQQPTRKLDPRYYQPEPRAYEHLGLVNVKIGPPSSSATAASDTSAYETLRLINQSTMLYDAHKRQFRPNVFLQPDVAKYWSRNAWANRAVVGDDRYHVLFTTLSSSDDGGKLTENRHVEGKVRGDVFVLRLSEDVDEEGRRYYVDLEEGELDRAEGVWEELAGMVERFVEERERLMARGEEGEGDGGEGVWKSVKRKVGKILEPKGRLTGR